MLTLKQIDTLKHLIKVNFGDKVTYWIDMYIPNECSLFGKFRLEFYKNDQIYDYSQSLKTLLTLKNITDKAINENLYEYYSNVKYIRLQKFTLEKAQDLITRTILSLTEIIARYNESKLLKQIDEL